MREEVRAPRRRPPREATNDKPTRGASHARSPRTRERRPQRSRRRSHLCGVTELPVVALRMTTSATQSAGRMAAVHAERVYRPKICAATNAAAPPTAAASPVKSRTSNNRPPITSTPMPTASPTKTWSTSRMALAEALSRAASTGSPDAAPKSSAAFLASQPPSWRRATRTTTADASTSTASSRRSAKSR